MPYPKFDDRSSQPSAPSSLTPLTNPRADCTNELAIAESLVQLSIRTGSKASESSSTPQILQPASPLTEREHLVIIAGVVVAIQAQLFTSNSVATTSIPTALLCFGIIFELLGALLAIASLRIHPQADESSSSRSSLSRSRVTIWLSAVFILTGIVGLAVVLVETFKV